MSAWEGEMEEKSNSKYSVYSALQQQWIPFGCDRLKRVKHTTSLPLTQNIHPNQADFMSQNGEWILCLLLIWLIIIILALQQSFICGQCPFLFPRPFQDGSNIFKWWMQYIKDLSNFFRKNPIYSAAGRKKWRIIFDSGSRHVSPCG